MNEKPEPITQRLARDLVTAVDDRREARRLVEDLLAERDTDRASIRSLTEQVERLQAELERHPTAAATLREALAIREDATRRIDEADAWCEYWQRAAVVACRERDEALAALRAAGEMPLPGTPELTDLSQPTVAATEYTVTLFAPGTAESGAWDLTVQARSGGRWVVKHLSKFLGRDGSWSYGHDGTDPDAWYGVYYFDDLEAALRLAREVAPTVRVNRCTAAEAAAQAGGAR